LELDRDYPPGSRAAPVPCPWPKSFPHQTEVAVRAAADLRFPTFVSFLHLSPLAPEVLHRGYERARRCWRAHRAPRHRMCARRRPARLVLRPGRSFFGAKRPPKWTVPSWLPCRVGSAAGRRSKSSSGCVTEGSTCGVHSVVPFGLSSARPRSLSRTPSEDRARAVVERSPAFLPHYVI
jgi:hypothetical protein